MSQLTDSVRAKYPGIYDDMSDDDLEKSVLAKYPQYKDMAKPSEPAVVQALDPVTQPITNVPPPTAPEPSQDSIITDAYNLAFKTPKFITDITGDVPQGGVLDAVKAIPDVISGLIHHPLDTLEGGAEGAIQGAATLLSPANLLTLGRGKLSSIAGAIVGGVQGLHGADEIYHDNVASGAGDIGLGILTALTGSHSEVPEPTIHPKIKPELPVGAGIDPATLPPDLVPMGSEAQYNKPNLPVIAPTNTEDDLYRQASEKFGMGKPFDPNSLQDLKKTNADVPSIFADVDKLRASATRKSFTFDAADGSFKPTNTPNIPAEVTPGKIDLSGAETPNELAASLKRTRNQLLEPNSRPKTNDELRSVAPEDKFPKQPAGDGKPPKKPSNQIEPLSPNAEPILIKMKVPEPKQASMIAEAWNFDKGMMSVDLPFISSAAFRQGHQLFGTEAWLKAWAPSIKSYGSKAFYEANNALLHADPLMQKATAPVLNMAGKQVISNGRPVFKELPSIMDKMGIKLSTVHGLEGREEVIRASLPERIPIYGRHVAGNNRAYTAWLNNARLGAARNLYDAMPNNNDEVVLKQIGDLVNSFTGRGKLGIEIPKSSSYFGKEVRFDKPIKVFGKEIKIGGHELAAEKYAYELSQAMWSPKLLAARMQALNPINYTMMQPQVRKEYLLGALRSAGAWMTLAGLAKVTGLGEVSLNPTSADFGKVRIGNFRMDPAGGFQQLLVLSSKLATGESTSTNTNKTSDLTKAKGPYDPTRGSVIRDFLENKLHPRIKEFVDAAFASKSNPYNVIDKELQHYIPMLTTDLVLLGKEHPELVPLLAPLISAGVGGQYYEKGSFGKPQVTPIIDDILGTDLQKKDITLGR